MASQKNRRRSRKGRQARSQDLKAPRVATAQAKPDAAPATPRAAAQPRVAPQTRRQLREQREREAAIASRQSSRLLGTYGERPVGIFGPIPVAEVCLLAGIVAVIVGAVQGGGTSLVVGVIVCMLSVLGFTVREHFSGYRSHASLLSAFPTVIIEVILAEFVGVPRVRVLILVPVIPVFALSFWLLTRQFRNARHARVARSPL